MGALATSVVVSGLLTVFLALIILIGAVYVMGKVLHREKPAKSDPPAPPSAKPAASVAAPAPAPAPVGEGTGAEMEEAAVAAVVAALQVESGIEEETVAVIMAAVSAMMDAESVQTPWQVTGVQRAKPARPVWELAGLMQNTKPF